MVSYIDQAKGSVSKAWLNLDDWVLCPLFPPKLPPPLELVDLEGKRVLVTGSNSGIGKEMALFFAGHGADVFLLCRSDCPHETPASEVRDDIKAKTGNTNVHVEVLDMSSFDGVKGFVERWSTRSPDDRRIDILMNNAGMFPARKMTTSDGFEATYQINFLSHFLLTTSLLRLSCFAPNARIIQTTSVASFWNGGQVAPTDPNSQDALGGLREGDGLSFAQASLLYARSKASLVIWTRELQERLAKTDEWNDVTVQCHHPGAVASNWYKDPTGMGALAITSKFAAWVNATLIPTVGITPAQGAVMPIYLATSPEATRPGSRGRFWSYGRWKWTPGWMEDVRLRKALWMRWEEDAGVEAAL